MRTELTLYKARFVAITGEYKDRFLKDWIECHHNIAPGIPVFIYDTNCKPVLQFRNGEGTFIQKRGTFDKSCFYILPGHWKIMKKVIADYQRRKAFLRRMGQ